MPSVAAGPNGQLLKERALFEVNRIGYVIPSVNIASAPSLPVSPLATSANV